MKSIKNIKQATFNLVFDLLKNHDGRKIRVFVYENSQMKLSFSDENLSTLTGFWFCDILQNAERLSVNMQQNDDYIEINCHTYMRSE